MPCRSTPLVIESKATRVFPAIRCQHLLCCDNVPVMDTRHRLATSAAIALLAVAPASATAYATPSVGTSATVLSQTTADGIDYIIREITIVPGGSTGWHYHNPVVYGIVRSGTLTHTLANCQEDGTFGPGAAVAEGQGADHTHLGRNLGAEPLVMWVSYIAPTGTSSSVEVPDPGCGFA